jgi:hypothetical protein
MTENTSYVVSWTAIGAAGDMPGEHRRFDEWEPALAFYDDVIASRHTESARLVEVTEREVRAFEHEPRHTVRE